MVSFWNSPNFPFLIASFKFVGMNQSLKIVTIAAFMGILLAFALCDQEDRQTNQSEHASPSSNQEAITPSNDIPSPISPSSERTRQQEQYGDEFLRQVPALDLKVQERMADSTELLEKWAKIGVWISGFGVALLIANLLYTRIIIRADRAWMAYGPDIQVRDFRDEKGGLVALEKTFVIKNVGKSPALNLIVGFAEFDGIPNDYDLGQIIDRTRKETRARIAIGQEQETYREHTFTRAHLDEIASGEFNSVIHICCIYETIYGEEYIMQWTARTHVKTLPGISGGHNKGIQFDPVGDNNRICRSKKVKTYPYIPGKDAGA